MPTPVSHLAVGFAVAAWAQPGVPSRRVCVIAAACAGLPDIDVLGAALPGVDASLFGHRAITHSLAFAILAAALATSLFFRSEQWAQSRLRIGLILGLASLSHGCLDALSTYSTGLEFFAPLSQQRFRFPWTPLGNPHWSLGAQLGQEAVFVFLPAVLLAWSAFKLRRGQVSPRPAAA
jgi:inner membrane protein